MAETGSKSPARHALFTERLVNFAVSITDIVEALPENRLGNYVGSQLLRSGTSPAPNYAEAISAESRRDFIHKLGIGLKELRETHVWLNVIKRKGLLHRQEFLEQQLDECNQLIAIFAASVATAKRGL